ncbi:unnamed protein product, partial [marine sediment metagenome]
TLWLKRRAKGNMSGLNAASAKIETIVQVLV